MKIDSTVFESERERIAILPVGGSTWSYLLGLRITARKASNPDVSPCRRCVFGGDEFTVQVKTGRTKPGTSQCVMLKSCTARHRADRMSVYYIPAYIPKDERNADYGEPGPEPGEAQPVNTNSH